MMKERMMRKGVKKQANEKTRLINARKMRKSAMKRMFVEKCAER